MSRRPWNIDISGTTAGRLTALRFVCSRGQYKIWEFSCSCGGTKLAHAADFKRGKVLSCGCLNREKRIARTTKHGRGGDPEYQTWRAMRSRCAPRAAGRKYYHDQGVKVCARWDDYLTFLADVGPKPSPLHTLDRYPNPFGDYEPGNVRWATPSEQQENRRDRVKSCG